MTYEDQDRPTWDGEAIAEAVGRQLARLGDTGLWTDESFLEWLGSDLRTRAEGRARATDPESSLRHDGVRLRTRLLARQSGVAVVQGPPRLLEPTRRGLPAAMLDEAAAAGAAVLVNLAAAAGAGRELWDEPGDRWVALPRGAPPMRALALRIAGESMAPLLRSADTVLVEVGSALARGRIVVARHSNVEDGYVCKRVERVCRREVLLGSLDPAYGTLSIHRDARLIIGTVRTVWRASSGGGN
jgi:SOS-response transcriptional repressor LexA